MSKIHDLAGTLFGALVLVLVLRSFALATYYNPSEFMVPTLEIGDRVAALKFSFGYSRFSLVERLFMVGDNRDNSLDSRFAAILYSFASCTGEQDLRCAPRRLLERAE